MFLLKYKVDGLIVDNVRYFCDWLFKIFAYWDVLRFFHYRKFTTLESLAFYLFYIMRTMLALIFLVKFFLRFFFVQRWREREREIETSVREEHRSAVFDRELNHNLLVPGATHSTNWATLAGLKIILMELSVLETFKIKLRPTKSCSTVHGKLIYYLGNVNFIQLMLKSTASMNWYPMCLKSLWLFSWIKLISPSLLMLKLSDIQNIFLYFFVSSLVIHQSCWIL